MTQNNINFKLDEDFVERYSELTPPFGFNGAGFLAYFRSYSRKRDDGSKEDWYQTVERVVNGTYSVQKRHIIDRSLGWDEEKAQRSAQEMYDRMFNMKFLPPGRGLWAMGSAITEDKGLFAALNNCAFVSTKTMHEDPTKPFRFMMDMSMCGVGVGFDTKGAGKVTISEPYKEETCPIYTIPDSREGWVESLNIILEQYLKDREYTEFDYSEIRAKGEPIKTFGGIAPGPDPLKKLHKQIREQLGGREGEELTSRDIVDLMNKVGVCVVSGNVRRSAELALGDPEDDDYLKLKDYEWNAEEGQYEGSEVDRSGFGWVSNNSIFAKKGMDYGKHAHQTALNGEPGYQWMENAQKYSRMKDAPDWKDKRADGANPCVEQTLESYELCCLVETFPSRAESLEDFKRTLKFAYLYAKTVTLCNTHWTETNRVMMRNRRIGCSMSGISQFLDRNSIGKLKEYCEEGYETVQYYDKVYSDWFCVPKSIKTTSVKPSGTVSLLPGVTPGVHFPEDNFYIRRITLDKGSTVAQVYREAGYNVEDAVDDDTAVKVEIPVKIEGVRTIDEVSMWEQLSLTAFMQKYWADNQVSSTVTFKEHEADQIEHALNYFQYQLKGVSFLPKTEIGSYPQMPYEPISEEKFEQMSADTENEAFIKDGLKYLDEDEVVDPEANKFCDNDVCEV